MRGLVTFGVVILIIGVIVLGCSFVFGGRLGDLQISGVDYDETISAKGVESLELDIGYLNVYIKEGGEDFQIDAHNVKGDFNYEVIGDTLRITQKHTSVLNFDFSFFKDSYLNLYVPEGFNADEMKINLSAGNLESETQLSAKDMVLKLSAGNGTFESLKADELELKSSAGNVEIDAMECGSGSMTVSAGNVELYKLNADNLKVKASAGNVNLEGTVKDSLDIGASAGNVELVLDGGRADYCYDIGVSAGDLRIDDEKIDGSEKHDYMENNGGPEINIKASAGSVRIDFDK